MRRSSFPPSAAVVCAALLLIGCAATDATVGHKADLSNEDARIAVASDGADGATHIGFFDRSEYQEYRLSAGDGRTAESLYARVHPVRDRYILDLDPLVADTVTLWRAHAERPLTFGAAARVPTDVADFWVRPFRRDAPAEACFGYVGAWDRQFDDQQIRPRSLLFGYACRSGNPFTPDEISGYINGISVAPTSNVALHINDGVNGPWQTRAVDAATLATLGLGPQATDSDTGMRRFPLLLARRYVRSVPSSGG